MSGWKKPDHVEAELNAIIGNPRDAWKRYRALEESADGRVINVDICRNLSPEYGVTGLALRKRRTLYTEATFKPAKTASRLFFEHEVARRKSTDVLFTGGGPASGKTTALKNVSADAIQKFGLILDTSLTNLAEVVQQIRLCHQHQHTVHITWVYCPFPTAIAQMLARAARIGRYITLARMAALHRSSHEVILHLAEHIDRYSSPRRLLVLHVIDSTGEASDLTVVGNGAKPTAVEKRTLSKIRRRLADNLTHITDQEAHHAFEAFRQTRPLPRDVAQAVQR